MQEKNRRPKKFVAPVAEKIPLVSVVIPMFNSAKFIAQTLESLVNQTMTDFEVVVVDDCSTDNSVEVVESFSERFGRRLHVIKLAKNNGAPAIPRNIGIQFARGKYIAFLDNDDLFTKTALEELTALAEEHQADVVNMPAFFQAEDNGSNLEELLNPANHKIKSCQWQNTSLQKDVIVFPNNIADRVKFWHGNKFNWATWATFVKRDFWISNQIRFPDMPVSDDMLANFACLCFAQKILSVPNIVYIHRKRLDSISLGNTDVVNFIHKWLSNLVLGFKALEEIMSHVPFFKEHPDYRYATVNLLFNRCIDDARYFPAVYAKISPAVLQPFVEKEFSSDDAPLAAYLFNTLNIYRLQIMGLQQELNALKQSR